MSLTAFGIERARIQIPLSEADGVRVVNAAAELVLGAGGGIGLVLSAEQVELAPPLPAIRGLTLDCRNLRMSEARIECAAARLRLEHDWIAAPDARVDLVLVRASGELQLRVRGLRFADGTVDLSVETEADGRWSAIAELGGVSLRGVDAIAAAVLGAPTGFSAGSVSGKISLAGRGATMERLAPTLEFDGVAWAAADAANACERVSGRVSATVRNGSDDASMPWSIDAFDLRLDSADVLAGDWFVTAPPSGLKLTARGTAGSERLALRELMLASPGLFSAHATGLRAGIAPEPHLENAQVEIELNDLAGVFSQFVKDNLSGPVWEAARVAGRAKVHARWQDALVGLQWQTELPELALSAGRVDARGLHSTGRWRADAPGEASVGWDSATLFGDIPVGASVARLDVQPRGVSLAEPLEIPLIDGALHIDRLRATRPTAGADLDLSFDGFLKPVSLERLSTAFGWPPLRGVVSGMIPGVELSAGNLRLDGQLLVRAFDGSLRISRLEANGLFGEYPIVSADVDLQPLDLEALTGAFEVGRITGRLGGHIRGLVLENWQPRAFEMLLATPADDRSRRRISQRAVDQFTELGGSGVAGALSRSYLRFFEDFGYSRLGLEGRLEGSVFEIRGVEPAEHGGYYLVKGSGLPRVDVIGFNQRVDWAAFLANLNAAMTRSDEIQVR
ncbi:MAG: hypothetical protein KDG50_15695 [Chromatiales bacterium]|nr:hypothetical protein [Chromatiales bacterium]